MVPVIVRVVTVPMFPFVRLSEPSQYWFHVSRPYIAVVCSSRGWSISASSSVWAAPGAGTDSRNNAAKVDTVIAWRDGTHARGDERILCRMRGAGGGRGGNYCRLGF